MTMTAEPTTNTNVDTDAATTVRESIDVNVPVSVAYDQWTQFESFPKFMDNVQEITQIDDTHNHWRVKVAGAEREFDTEISEQIPDQKIAWHSTGGEKHAGVVSFNTVDDDTTRVILEMDWEPAGAVEKIGSALNLEDRQVKKDLRKFKDFIEDQGSAEGSWRGEVSRE